MNIDFPSLDPDSKNSISSKMHLLELTDEAIKEWIACISCNKCGRKKICAYYNVDENEKCLVIQHFIRNVFLELAPIYESKNKNDREKLLKSLYALTQFAFETELYTGYFQTPDFIQSVYAEGITNKVIGSVANIKRFADQFLENSKDIVELQSRSVVILTEGASELAFLSELYPDRSFDIEDYDGDGNKKKKKLLPLMQHYQKMGYRIFAQSDLDGKNIEHNGFKNYFSNGSIEFEIDNTFAFKNNLEQSYPAELIYLALQKLKIFISETVPYEGFVDEINKVGNKYDAINKFTNIPPSKVKLAITIANMIRVNRLEELEYVSSSELGAFIKFVKNAVNFR